MKTTTNKIISFLTKKKSFLLAVSLFIITKNCFCQTPVAQHNENLGFIASSMISANQYGGQYSPMIYYKNDRRSYALGPVIQNNNLNFSGVQFNYDYTIVSNNESCNKNLELFCFITTSYYNNAMFGKKAIWEEHMANQGYEGDVCKLRFKSAEVFGGVGLKIKLFKNIKWVNSIGLGGSACFNFPGHLYNDANNTGLILKTGISFDFNH